MFVYIICRYSNSVKQRHDDDDDCYYYYYYASKMEN